MNAPLPRGIPADVIKRELVERHIEELIALLDDLDGDLDQEPDSDAELSGDEDEPWLAAPEAKPKLYPAPVEPLPRRRTAPIRDPELSRDPGSSQLAWSRGGLDDREDDAGDNGEPDEDGEAWRQPARLDVELEKRHAGTALKRPGGGSSKLLLGVTGPGLGRLRGLPVFDTALIAEVATFLSLLLALGRFPVLESLLFHEPRRLLDFTLDAHRLLLSRA